MICIVALIIVTNRRKIETALNGLLVRMRPPHNYVPLREAFVIIELEPTEPNETDVHDPIIRDTSNSSFDRLIEWFRNLDPNQSWWTWKEVDQTYRKKFLFGTDRDPDITERAMNTYKTMRKNTVSIVHSYTEKELLNMILARIMSPINQHNMKNMLESLTEELADSSKNIDSDDTVCTTGRITRLLQSLQGLDAENIVDIHNEGTLSEEMQYLIPSLLDRYFECNIGSKQMYEQGEHDQNLIDTITKQIKNRYPTLRDDIFTRVIKPYIDTLTENPSQSKI
jgi:hypothetical protein